MPQFKQPQSLRGGCVARVAQLVVAACIRIHAGPESIQDGAEILQQHLLAHVWPLADEICAHVLGGNKHRKLGRAAETILKVFSQCRVTSLRYLNVGNLNTEFWKSCIPSAKNLIELDLSNLVYIQRHMLLAISDNCQSLQFIFLPFLCVSSEDFCLLERIKSLRIIGNRCVHEFSTNPPHKFGYNYKRTCITRLLSQLPTLEYIDCNCMGAVLGDLRCELFPSLQYCWEMEPTRCLIEAVAQTSPNLEHLVLGNVLYSDFAFDLTPLVESSLSISALTLHNFSFDSSAELFLHGKGTFLRSFELGKTPEINAEQIRIIGRHCRHLQHLTIYLRAKPGKQRDNSGRGLTTYEVDEPVFENLFNFSLSADERLGKSYVGLLACLAHAKKIRAIVFKEGASSDSQVESGLESCLTDLIGRNSMDKLESVIVRGRNLRLSKKMIKHLHDLPKIKTLTLKLNHEKETKAYLEEMKLNIACNNLDIKLNY